MTVVLLGQRERQLGRDYGSNDSMNSFKYIGMKLVGYTKKPVINSLIPLMLYYLCIRIGSARNCMS